MEHPTRVEVRKNGPLRVYSEKIEIEHGEHTIEKLEVVSFCRCGKSQKQPFCDGSHKEMEPFE